MLKLKARRQARQNARAESHLAAIHASIIALDDEDLLDIADIFNEKRYTPIAAAAFAEMARRKIAL